MNDLRTIIYEVENGRARITLNRPEKLNALSLELQQELNEALWEADNDTNVRAVILRGNGRAFSAGYDLTPLANRRPAPEGDHYTAVYRGGRTFDDDAWQLERAQRLRMAIFDMHKPVIAQVHGYCLAGGTDIALLCDIIIAADDATIGFPPARAMGSLPNQMWVYHCGPQVGQAPLPYGGHGHRCGSRQDRARAEVGTGEPARTGSRVAGRPDGDDRLRAAERE